MISLNTGIWITQQRKKESKKNEATGNRTTGRKTFAVAVTRRAQTRRQTPLRQRTLHSTTKLRPPFLWLNEICTKIYIKELGEDLKDSGI